MTALCSRIGSESFTALYLLLSQVFIGSFHDYRRYQIPVLSFGKLSAGVYSIKHDQ